MKEQPLPENCSYYTASHEWIRFTGKAAFIGISQFKINNTRKIKKIRLVKVYGCKQRGEVFARIKMDFQEVDLYMPVDGSIIQINNMDRLINEKLLMTDPESQGWLVKISLHAPIEKNNLLTKEQYSAQYPTAKPHHL